MVNVVKRAIFLADERSVVRLVLEMCVFARLSEAIDVHQSAVESGTRPHQELDFSALADIPFAAVCRHHVVEGSFSNFDMIEHDIFALVGDPHEGSNSNEDWAGFFFPFLRPW